ncbi:hypothetical protein ACOZ35_03250 [Halorubrum xinjiangense]|uniref:hypothetical protein n=1 Tax=Halorubrum xinjiangense TaxID=261291 RepID=UPI003C700DDC
MKLNILLVVLLVSSSFVGVVAADDGPLWDDVEKATSVYYDEATCEQYQPYLSLDHVEVSPDGLYCAVYESPDHDTDVIAYWARYPVQFGYTNADSHVGDREPIYVHVDDQTGEIDKVVYSAYHYYAGETSSPQMAEVNGSDYPSLYVFEPHHHYAPRTFTTGELVDVKPFVSNSNLDASASQDWVSNGWDVNHDAIVDPWSISAGDNWWPDDSYDGRLSAVYWGAMQTVYDVTGYDIGGKLGSLF